MYHYVRPIRDSRFPGIKGLERTDFFGQLDYIERHYQVVRVEDVLKHSRDGSALPANPLLLTFDDGYKDHAQHVFPELSRRRMSGVFFPPARAVLKREMLDVNKIHYVLASCTNPLVIVRFLDAEIEKARQDNSEMRSIDELRQEYFVANRFDSPEVNYIKRLLQVALPKALRTRLADTLFREYVSADSAGFADEIYLNQEDLARMIDGGMEIGSHGNHHDWMNQLPRNDQSQDLDASLEFLAGLGLSKEGFIYCYPYGAYNSTTLELLRERHCSCAFTTKFGVFGLEPGKSLLEISRLDTNDLPKHL
jgi:hypothetical protein